jgi:hypothetical protein
MKLEIVADDFAAPLLIIPSLGHFPKDLAF